MISIENECPAGLSCGVDLVDIASLGRALEVTKGRLKDVCFTSREQREAANRNDRLATRWAVKEAVAKALGVGLLQGVGFHDIEVTAKEAGGLKLLLHGEARRLARNQQLNRWTISVSHESGVAVGFVIARRSPESSFTETTEEGQND